MIEIIAVGTPSLGDRSYLVTDGEVAFVVDPQRDVDRMLRLAERRGVDIRGVFETHVHNDYVTGGPALAAATGADYHVNAADPVAFHHCPIQDGDVIEAGELQLRVLATPGHTFTHLSYALEVPGRTPAVFTGGSLLYGSTGRPDLLGPEHTDALVRAQYASAHRLARELPPETEVYPTHGFGSFCSSAQSEEVTESTIGRESKTNPVLTRGEEEYAEALLAGLDAYPAYYAHMAALNLAGPDAPDLSPPHRAGAAELRRRLRDGEWVVDLRSRTAFAAGHLPGTLNFGLDGGFAVHLGWLIPWGTPVTLLGATPEEVAEAQRELARIGVDRPAAAATGGPADWVGDGGEKPASLPLATFADLSAVRRERPVVVLDVRRSAEWRESHLPGAVNIPLHELPARLDEVPPGEVWTHCATGYRAAVAASLLAAAGRDVVAVDDTYPPGTG
ncbi:MBL fold metallo-hydrolase [Microbispora triticiradicis]|uniref:MBL fold metallo-hydrolase n=1 Tax=Microbispora triticiradicis TaxID=2200763 RepID=A0ABX9LFI7_9ACTN|nr:MBL fold metallo-hydrolase [Microbispora triticiradicis]RGA02739.1 MBL fold metallo-hydrolase [Microbispora triticiradicis]